MLAENHLDLNMFLLNYCDLKEVAHHASVARP